MEHKAGGCSWDLWNQSRARWAHCPGTTPPRAGGSVAPSRYAYRPGCKPNTPIMLLHPPVFSASPPLISFLTRRKQNNSKKATLLEGLTWTHIKFSCNEAIHVPPWLSFRITAHHYLYKLANSPALLCFPALTGHSWLFSQTPCLLSSSWNALSVAEGQPSQFWSLCLPSAKYFVSFLPPHISLCLAFVLVLHSIISSAVHQERL